MKNKYSNLSFQELVEEYGKMKKARELAAFNSTFHKKQFEANICFLEAEHIKRFGKNF